MTPSLATDRRPTTCPQPPCGGGWPAPSQYPLSTAPTRDYGLPGHSNCLLGSAIAETVIADPVWPSLVAAVAASGWPPRDLLAARSILVLPRRNEDLEGVPAWLDHHLADKPPEHANPGPQRRNRIRYFLK